MNGKWAIVDFSGFYWDDRFIIKELSFYKSDSNNRRVETLIPQSEPENYDNNNPDVINAYNEYQQFSGIRWNISNITFDHFEEALHFITADYTVYVESYLKRRQLKNFIADDFHRGCEIMKHFGFYRSSQVTLPSCEHHIEPSLRSYCTMRICTEMLQWFTARLQIRSFVVDFNGFSVSEDDDEFMIKEISMIGLDSRGRQLHRSSFVTNFSNVDRSIETRYQESYFRTYGISWDSGTYDEDNIYAIIRDIIDVTPNLDLMIVKNERLQKILIDTIFGVHEIISVEQLGYDQSAIIVTNPVICEYHEHDVEIDDCALFGAGKITDWVQKHEKRRLLRD